MALLPALLLGSCGERKGAEVSVGSPPRKELSDEQVLKAAQDYAEAQMLLLDIVRDPAAVARRESGRRIRALSAEYARIMEGASSGGRTAVLQRCLSLHPSLEREVSEAAESVSRIYGTDREFRRIYDDFVRLIGQGGSP